MVSGHLGAGKRVVCMDGLRPLRNEMLAKELSLVDVAGKKARRGAESGNPFIQVRDLY